MQPNKKKTFMRKRRQRRLRGRLSGTAANPRLAVFRSLRQIYVQIMNGLGKYDTTYEPSQVRAYSSSGKLLWKLLIPGMNADSGVHSQPVLLDDGTLVLAAWVETKTEQGAFLYGIQTKSPGMAKSAWPRALHDNANTSRLTPP